MDHYLWYVFVKKDLRIVPISVGHGVDYEKIAKEINSLGKEFCLVISSDFTHYGASYQYLPFSENVKEKMYGLDRGAIDLILKKESVKFLDYCDRTGATICGQFPIALGLEILKKKDCKGRLLKYYTSADVMGD